MRFTASHDEIGQLALQGGVLAAADDSGEIRMHDACSGASLTVLAGGHSSLCGCIAFRPSRPSELFSAGLDAVCVRWDWRLAAQIDTWPLARPIDTAATMQLLNPRHAHCMSFCPDGGVVALALGDGSLELRLAETGEAIAAVDAHRSAASQARFEPRLTAAMNAALAALPPGNDADSSGDSKDATEKAAGYDSAAQPLVSAGDDMRVRLWSVEGIAGHAAPRTLDAPPKRHKLSVIGSRSEPREPLSAPECP